MVLQFGPDDDTPVADQAAVIEAFHEGTGRVAVDAAAGTGKTTTMLMTVAEVVARNATMDDNPFSSILLTTFTRDAASELQEELREVLRSHVAAGGELPADVFRWLETDSQVRTIDSLFNDLLGEAAPELDLPPNFELESSAELQEIRDDAFTELRIEYREEFARLENAYPDESWRQYPPDTVRETIETAQQKCREFCITPTEARETLFDNLDDAHGGETPPKTFDDVRELLETVVFEGAELTVDETRTADPAAAREAFTTHVTDTYERSRQLVEDFSMVLSAYEQRYEALTRERGHLTYQDATHVLRTFVKGNSDHPFVESLRRRFDYVFVDEFQDTSAAQCRVLRELITDIDTRTRLLAIGDVKQSIYQWRSADPGIFGEIVERARDAGDGGGHVPYLDANDVAYRALTSNFRSHPGLIRAANGFFGDVFDDASRGGFGDVGVSYNDVTAAGPRQHWDDEDPHFHVLPLDLGDGFPNRGGDWTPAESWTVASRIAAMVRDETDVTVFDSVDDGEVEERTPRPGDVTLLFQARTHMHRYVDALSEFGIDAAPRATDDLFEQSEVTLLIDVLYWFTNPHDEASLMRILRSPFVACSDRTIRYVASEEFYLGDVLTDGAWPDELPEADRDRLEALVELRDDLRWDREGSKTNLLNRIIRHAAFDTVVLSDEDGLRKYGNVWALTEIVDGWEEQELLPYREFVERLTRLRDRAGEGREPDHTVAEVADPEDEETVTLTTVHSAKGLDYPIVFLVDALRQWDTPALQGSRLVADRDRGMVLRPVASDAPLPDAVDFPSPDDEVDAWMNEDRDASKYPKLTGPIWISNDIDPDTGEFEYANQLNQFLAPSRGEFWRVLYVAFTRAEDHLFVGLADLPDWVEDITRWTTWVMALNETFQPSEGWDGSKERIEVDTRSGQVTVGVDDVGSVPPEDREAVTVGHADRYLDAEPMSRHETVPYRPNRVSPSRIHDLVECPRRYQYEYVQEVAPAYGGGPELDRDGQPLEEAASPGGVEANEWGTTVHKALEYRLQGRDRLAQYANTLDPELREYALWVVEAMERDVDTYRAALDADHVYPEYDVSTALEIEGDEVIVTGEIDLLYEASGVWYLADYKTTDVHGHESYAGGKYARQLRTYAWLLEQTYDVEVGRLELLYVDVDKAAESVDVTPVSVERKRTGEAYEQSLRDELRTISVEPPEGLSARPTETRCGSCPYSARRGGPCEH